IAPNTPQASGRIVIAREPAMRGPMSVPASTAQSVRTEATMTQLQERWDGRWGGPFGRPQPQPRVWGYPGAQFGTSSRSPYGFGNRPYDPDDDEEDRDGRFYGTYRT